MKYEDAQEAHEIINEIIMINVIRDNLSKLEDPDYVEILGKTDNVKIHNAELIEYLKKQAILYLDNKISEAKDKLTKIGKDVSNKTILMESQGGI